MTLPMIRLKLRNGSKLIVRADLIRGCTDDECTDTAGAFVSIEGQDDPINVVETPENIASLVAGAIEWANTRVVAAQAQLAQEMQKGLVLAKPMNGRKA